MVGHFGYAIAKAEPFENLTILNSTFKKSGFEMVGFQIPTVCLKELKILILMFLDFAWLNNLNTGLVFRCTTLRC